MYLFLTAARHGHLSLYFSIFPHFSGFFSWSLLGLGPFWLWSLLGLGLFWLVPFGRSLLAGPFLPVPYGLVPFDFQRLLVLLVCLMSRNWGYSRSLSLVWMVICSVISTNSSTLHSSCLPRMEAIKKSHNKSYCFFFRENKATKILWAKEVINNS